MVNELIGELSSGNSLAGELSGGDSLSGLLSEPTGGVPLRPATTTTLGGIIVGSDLQITSEGVLSVDKATTVEEDNTRPITAAAVYTEVGNINVLLQTI